MEISERLARLDSIEFCFLKFLSECELESLPPARSVGRFHGRVVEGGDKEIEEAERNAVL
jgi:hypothetical protein